MLNFFHLVIQCKDAVSGRLIMRHAQNRAHRKGERRQKWKPQTKRREMRETCFHHIFHRELDCCCLHVPIWINLTWANHFFTVWFFRAIDASSTHSLFHSQSQFFLQKSISKRKIVLLVVGIFEQRTIKASERITITMFGFKFVQIALTGISKQLKCLSGENGLFSSQKSCSIRMNQFSIAINWIWIGIGMEWSRWTIFRCVCRCCRTLALIYGRAYIIMCIQIQNQTRLIKVFDLIACCWFAYIFYYGTTKARLMAFISLFQHFMPHVFLSRSLKCRW